MNDNDITELNPSIHNATKRNCVTSNPWEKLRAFTDARIGLGRAGTSVPTHHLLKFQLEHARAQDAVHTPLNCSELIPLLQQQSWKTTDAIFQLKSQAKNRPIYLQRPDLGRKLSDASCTELQRFREHSEEEFDLAIAIVDGLSAYAIEKNVEPFLSKLVPKLICEHEDKTPWKLAPLCLVEQGRVAIGDHIGEILKAKCILVIVGERPGLSSPDSMGLYLTWGPKVGLTDSSRNCISNVRPAGLRYEQASARLMYLLSEARKKQVSGVTLKDRSQNTALEKTGGDKNFLISQENPLD